MYIVACLAESGFYPLQASTTPTPCDSPEHLLTLPMPPGEGRAHPWGEPRVEICLNLRIGLSSRQQSPSLLVPWPPHAALPLHPSDGTRDGRGLKRWLGRSEGRQPPVLCHRAPPPTPPANTVAADPFKEQACPGGLGLGAGEVRLSLSPSMSAFSAGPVSGRQRPESTLQAEDKPAAQTPLCPRSRGSSPSSVPRPLLLPF